MPPQRKRPFRDTERFYAYVWWLDDEPIWVGQGHNLRGIPSRSNVTGRPPELAEIVRSRWKEINVGIYPAENQQEAREIEVRLTLELRPKYNTAVGFAGFAGHKHADSTKELIRQSSTGRPASELCKAKSAERARERNRNNPPRKGKRCSEEHRRKLSEAAKRRRKCT